MNSANEVVFVRDFKNIISFFYFGVLSKGL